MLLQIDFKTSHDLIWFNQQIQLFNESKQWGLRFDRFNPDVSELSKILTCSGCAQLVDIFTKSIYPHINAPTGVYNPPNENSDPSLSSEYMLISK